VRKGGGGPGKTLPFKAEWLGQARIGGDFDGAVEAVCIHLLWRGTERRVDVVEYR
jgi:hypothetical protein